MSCGVQVGIYAQPAYWDAQHPDANLDYRFGWSQFLAPTGDTITDATVTGPAAITISNVTFTSLVVTFWVTGGTAGEEYTIECRITSAQGRTPVLLGILRVEDATSS